MNYGKAIRILRAEMGISQDELASLSGFSSSYVSRIENGDRVPTLKAVEAIAKALCIPVYLLMLLASEENDLQGLLMKILIKRIEELE